jgi:hypothetical protein
VLCRGAAAAQQLCQVLDDMHAMNARLADCFELCGAQHRSTGSHGVVEMALLTGTSVRFRFGQLLGPSVCYGPSAKGIHGVSAVPDEVGLRGDACSSCV